MKCGTAQKIRQSKRKQEKESKMMEKILCLTLILFGHKLILLVSQPMISVSYNKNQKKKWEWKNHRIRIENQTTELKTVKIKHKTDTKKDSDESKRWSSQYIFFVFDFFVVFLLLFSIQPNDYYADYIVQNFKQLFNWEDEKKKVLISLNGKIVPLFDGQR